MEDVEGERRRAEVFDALAHPTRIAILKALNEEPLSFSDLKRRMNIDSSGHLQHHLSKLSFLIKVNREGNYQLSDQGKDALFTLETVERSSRPGVREAVNLIRAYSSRARFALTLTALFLATLSLVSGVYISNIEQPLSYTSTQNQFFYEELYGGPLEHYNYIYVSSEGLYMASGDSFGGPFQISPGQTFNCTNFVNPKLEWYQLLNMNLVETEIPLPTSNATFHRFCYAVFKISINESIRWHASFVLIGPDGSEWPEVTCDSRAPPYETHPSRWNMEASAGMIGDIHKIAPITTYGNYTLSIVNLGNSTIDGTITAWSSQEVIIVRSLNENLNVTSRNIVKVYSVPTTTEEQTLVKPFHVWGIAISGASTTILAALGISFINRRRQTSLPQFH